MSVKRIAHVQISGKAGYRQDIEIRGRRLTADEPPTLDSTDVDPGPYDLVLAGLGACTAITLRMYAERKGWQLGEISVDLALFKDAAKADRIERKVRFSEPLAPGQRARLADICERTPVTLTIKQGAPIATEIVVDT